MSDEKSYSTVRMPPQSPHVPSGLILRVFLPQPEHRIVAFFFRVGCIARLSSHLGLYIGIIFM